MHPFFFLVKQVIATNGIIVALKQLTVWNPVSLDFSQFNQTVLEVKTLKPSYKIHLTYFYSCIKMLSVEGMLSDKTAA